MKNVACTSKEEETDHSPAKCLTAPERVKCRIQYSSSILGFFSPNNFAHFFMVSAKIYILLNTKEKKTNKSQKCEIITDMKESVM